jgi:hypothetical protein
VEVMKRILINEKIINWYGREKNYRLILSSERTLQNNKPGTV